MSKKRVPASSLDRVRRYTGDKFTPANGYDNRKGLSFGQRMAVLKYDRKISELTSKPYVEYTPRRGEKTEAFNYTGQKGFRAFTKALVYHPDTSHKLSFEIDKTLPKGSRFTVIDKGTKEAPRNPSRYFHVPAKVFLDYGLSEVDTDGETFDQDGVLVEDDLSGPGFAAFVQSVLDHYAPGAELFLIQAGDSYMWGAGSGRNNLAAKLQQIFTNYAPAFYDPNNKNSSYYGNWFKGVMAFTRRFDAFPAMQAGQKRKRDYREKYKLDGDIKYRELKDGRVIGMKDGAVIVPPFYVERGPREDQED